MTSKQMNIGIVSMQFPVASETFISARLRSLARMGHRLRVYALRGSAPGRQELAREREVDVIPTSHNGLFASLRGVLEAVKRPTLLVNTLLWLFDVAGTNPSQLARALAVLPRSFDILARLEHDPPDVLHAEWGHYPAIVARLVQKRLPSTVVSVSLIAYDLSIEFGGTVDVVREAKVIRTQARANVPHISRFTGVAEDRIVVVYDGVEFARIARLYGRVPKEPGRCVIAGRLVPEKGFDDAIRVFAAVRDKSPGASLRVLGDGPELARLQRLAEELRLTGAIEFLGHVPQERVIEEFARAQVLLHLSHSERLPNVVKEAMACHCACVTTRTVGIEELVEDGVTGFIVEHGGVEAATAIVVNLLEGKLPIESIGEAAHRFVATNFDHDSNVSHLAALWSSAMNSSMSRSVAEGRLAEPSPHH